MSIANKHADKFYFPHFQFKDSVNATYIIAFWDQTPCTYIGNYGKKIMYTFSSWNKEKIVTATIVQVCLDTDWATPEQLAVPLNGLPWFVGFLFTVWPQLTHLIARNLLILKYIKPKFNLNSNHIGKLINVIFVNWSW